MIKNLIKAARMLTCDDSGNFRFGTFSWLGKTFKGQILNPYGLVSRPPNNSFAMLLSQNGHESNVLAVVDDPINRTLKNLNEGEVGLTNYRTGAYVLMDQNDNIRAEAPNSISLTVGNTSLVVTDGVITINNAQLLVPNGGVNSNGDIVTEGGISAQGDITTPSNVTAGSVSLKTHTHSGVVSGGDDTGAPNT